jgi:hypothetical protein
MRESLLPPLPVIVCGGSRRLSPGQIGPIYRRLKAISTPVELITGGQVGGDRMFEIVGRHLGFRILTIPFEDRDDRLDAMMLARDPDLVLIWSRDITLDSGCRDLATLAFRSGVPLEIRQPKVPMQRHNFPPRSGLY